MQDKRFETKSQYRPSAAFAQAVRRSVEDWPPAEARLDHLLEDLQLPPWCDAWDLHRGVRTLVYRFNDQHFYLKVPDDRPMPGNSVNGLGMAIDTRGQGGFVVAPPSKSLAGEYRWVVSPNEAELAEAPAWLLDELPKRGGGQAKPVGEWDRLAHEVVQEGQRNETIASLAGLLLGKLASHDLACALVHCYNECYCEPPLPQAEVNSTLASIAAKEAAKKKGFGVADLKRAAR
jgi:hypothetical protein